MKNLKSFLLSRISWFVFSVIYFIGMIYIVIQWTNWFANPDTSTQFLMAGLFYGSFYMVIYVVRKTYLKENQYGRKERDTHS